MDPAKAMDLAERAQAMAQRDLYSTLFVVALVFIGVLAAAVWASWHMRLKDRDTFEAKLEALAREGHAQVAENAKAYWTLSRMLEDLRPRRRPAAVPEPPKEGTG